MPPPDRCKVEQVTVETTSPVPGSESRIIKYWVHWDTGLASEAFGGVPIPYPEAAIIACTQRFDYRQVTKVTTVLEVHSGPPPCPNRSYVLSRNSELESQVKEYPASCYTRYALPELLAKWAEDEIEEKIVPDVKRELEKSVREEFPDAVEVGDSSREPEGDPPTYMAWGGIQRSGDVSPTWTATRPR